MTELDAPVLREQIIQIARQGRASDLELRAVLAAARATDDRHILAVCLDCFRSVLREEQPETTPLVVRFLGELLRDPRYRRIRKRVLITSAWIGRAAHEILPDIIATYRRPRTPSVVAPARLAAIGIAWDALAEGDESERAAAISAFRALRSVGTLYLRAFLKSNRANAAAQAEVEAALRGSAAV